MGRQCQVRQVTMKTLLLLIACVAAAANAKTLSKRGAPKDFPTNACPYGRNDEMECCEANRQYTDDDGNAQSCCIGSYVKCAKELLKGQKSVHWSNNDRKKRSDEYPDDETSDFDWPE